MKPRRVLYLGSLSGTSLDRAQALRRLGHDVTHLDPRAMLPMTPWVDRLLWRLGGGMFAPMLRRALSTRLAGLRFDVCHVDNGDLISAAVLRELRQHARAIVSYTIDDPFGMRDKRRFSAFRAAVDHYDLVVVVREMNVSEARALGARRVLRVYMSADEVSHLPLPQSDLQLRAWRSDVLFLGTWMPERGPFLRELARLGVPLTIQGSRWHKAPEWNDLKPYYRGPALVGDDYKRAVQAARVNLGLLSKGNRDEHTTRSLEIPALGALLCGERTGEHLSMYREGQEALFWSDAKECAAVCSSILADEPRRRQIAEAGSCRVHVDRHFNEPTMARILDALESVE